MRYYAYFVRPAGETVQETNYHSRAGEKQKPSPAVIPAKETVQETLLGCAGGKPNPLNPPYQGDLYSLIPS